MKKIVLLFLIVTPFNIIRSQVQNPDFEWVMGMGSTSADYGNSVAIDLSGNVYVAGTFNGIVDFDPSPNEENLGPAYNSAFLAKYDASGAYQWAFALEGAGGSVSAQCVEIDALGNVYITGIFSGIVDFDPSPTEANLVTINNNAFLAKYDANGNYLWAISMGVTDYNYGMSIAIIAIDNFGNTYITGTFSGVVDFDPSPTEANLTSAGLYDIFLAKYDVNGNYSWAISMGGPEFDNGISVAIDASGNVYVTGSFNGTADFDPSANTANLTSAGETDIFLSKYNANGNYQWAISIGGGFTEWASCVAIDATGNAYITGSFYGTADFDPSATTVNLSPSGGCDAFLAKYDSNGSFVWVNAIGGTLGTLGNSLTIDAADNICLLGQFIGTADFDPSANTENLTSIGSEDIFLAKYYADGSYKWAISMGGTDTGIGDRGLSLALDNSDNIYLTGSFSGECGFDTGTGITNITSAGESDIFLAKYKDTLAGNTSINNTLTETDILSVYPNPANNILIIEHKDFKPLTFEIVNTLGQKTLNGQLTSEKTIIDISHLQPGIYLLKINDEVNCKMIKVIKK